MWQLIFICSALATSAVILAESDDKIAKGKWQVNCMKQCADPEEKYSKDMTITMKRKNCSDDAFQVTFDLKKEINDEFGIKVERWTKDDHQIVLIEPSFCNFIKCYQPETECPIPKDLYVWDYVYSELTEQCEESSQSVLTYSVYLTKDGEDVGCITIEMEFIADDDDDCDAE